MLFSSNIFLFLFLPATLVGYYILKPSYRNIFLLIMSLGFYAWGEPKFVLVMIGSIVFNYIMAILVDCARQNKKMMNMFMAFCVVGNLGLLFVYKYLDFFIADINRFGFDLKLYKLALPIGISFFTFQAMSYVIDVYRSDVPVQKLPQNVGLYIAFFPQLIAGPIVRYKDVEAQIIQRTITFDKFSEGVKRFIIGFSKKVLIANNVAIAADRAFLVTDGSRSVAFAWLGALAYALQIFFDFSGYSDMAIGLGKMFGFDFLENFNYPYISKSVSEFWRRWHMSLGQWFRDYVYFPLGGSRVKTKKRLIFNLFVVWFLTGFWHGASWNFIMWGLLYFVILAFEKLTNYPNKFKATWTKGIYRVFTLLCVLLGWVLFRALTLPAAFEYMKSMFGLTNNALSCDSTIMNFQQYGGWAVVGILCSTPLFATLGRKLKESKIKAVSIAADTAMILFYLFCFMWSVSFLIMGAHNPFIYFNF